MRKFLKRFNTFFLVICICFSFCISAFADEKNSLESEKIPVSSWAIAMPENTTLEDIKYYLITPSSEVWKTYTTSDEMIAACRIENEIIKTMSTSELVIAVLSYPMLGDLYAYNDIATGLNQLAEKSDAFKELQSRDDAVKYLYYAYNNTMKVKNINKRTSLAGLTIAILLSDISFYDYTKVITSSSVSTKSYYTTVTTPAGSSVTVIYRGEEFTQAYIDYLDDYFTTAYPNATLLLPSTTMYNCHNFAWNTDYPRTYWMNKSSAKVYMTDGSYTSTTMTNATHAYYGDTVDHSALVFMLDPPYAYPKVISKWGSGPLMSHSANYGPYSASNITYWS